MKTLTIRLLGRNMLTPGAVRTLLAGPRSVAILGVSPVDSAHDAVKAYLTGNPAEAIEDFEQNLDLRRS